MVKCGVHVYCDTNIYDNFLRPNQEAFFAFKRLKRAGTRFHGSAEVVQELAANANKPDRARQSLRIYEEICSPRCSLKAPDELVSEEIQAFLGGVDFNPFTSRVQANHLQDVADEIVRTETRFELRDADRASKVDALVSGKSWALRLAADPKFHRQEPFERWWPHNLPSLVDSSTEPLSVDAADRPRLVAAIDELPSLRTQCVTVLVSALSWMNNIHPNHGFEFDLKHALMASRADVFITADRRLRELLMIGRSMLPFEPMHPADFLTRYGVAD